MINNSNRFSICATTIVFSGSCMTATTTWRQGPHGKPMGWLVPCCSTSQAVHPVKNTIICFSEKLNRFCRNVLQPQTNSFTKTPCILIALFVCNSCSSHHLVRWPCLVPPFMTCFPTSAMTWPDGRGIIYFRTSPITYTLGTPLPLIV